MDEDFIKMPRAVAASNFQILCLRDTVYVCEYQQSEVNLNINAMTY